MSSFSKYHLLFFLSFSLLISCNLSLPIGITYSQSPDSNDPSQPGRVVSTVLSLGISSVRLSRPTPALIRSFSFSGISLLLSTPNTLLVKFASDPSQAIQWLSTHVVPFYPRTRIALISVGNDVLTSSSNLSSFLLPAIRNVQFALHELGIHKILVSTTLSFDVIKDPFPPSAARFQESVSLSVLKRLLDFLSATNSSFLINAHPYNLYRSNPEILIGFALFREQPFGFRDDLVTGLRYRNLFDVMIDAVITAMGGLGHEGLPVVVTETGWPSDGGPNESDATEMYAQMYNVGLVKYLKSGLGTPLRREGVAEVYIFELFDEDMKQSKQHWGILHLNKTGKYEIDFSGSIRIKGNEGGTGLMEMVVCFLLLLLFLL